MNIPWQWFLDSSNQELLLFIFISLGIGFFIGRGSWRFKESKGISPENKGDKAFFKGIQYIISNDHDHAIEEFTKSVQVNSETIETYIALGNLYRSKGDIDRAIRIRNSIILRPNIEQKIKLRALFDLGLDYRKGGLLNRALSIFLKVVQRDPSSIETLNEIERIYEEMKDWENAYRTRQKISRLVQGDHRHILAHHLVEMGKVSLEKNDIAEANSLFKKAISTDQNCVDAYLHQGDLYFSLQEYKKAISAWEKVAGIAPQFTFLAYGRLEGAYSKMKNLKPVEDFLKACAQSNSDVFTHLALARFLLNKGDIEGALKEVDGALEMAPYFWEARRFKGEIMLVHGKEEGIMSDYADLISHLDMPYLRFQCEQCGFAPNELLWQCPQCKRWDTISLIDFSNILPKASSSAKEITPHRSGGKEKE